MKLHMHSYGRKRTVPGRKHSSAGAVLFVCLLLCCLLAVPGKKEEEETGRRYYVRRESGVGTETIPLEEYLIGALAACMPQDSDEEVCKALAIALRTDTVQLCEKQGTDTADCEELGQASLSERQMREKWREDYENQLAKIKTAVEETKGMVLTYEGVFAKTPYFALSAGKSRDGEEALGEKGCPYLRSVDCGKDMEAADYLQETKVSKQEFVRGMEVLWRENTEEGTEEDGEGKGALAELSDYELKRDAAGYVLFIEWESMSIPGERLRQYFALPSAHFSWEETDDGVIFHTKGEGHGVGISLYTAGEMASSGADYSEILHYFFQNCEIHKN